MFSRSAEATVYVTLHLASAVFLNCFPTAGLTDTPPLWSQVHSRPAKSGVKQVGNRKCNGGLRLLRTGSKSRILGDQLYLWVYLNPRDS